MLIGRSLCIRIIIGMMCTAWELGGLWNFRGKRCALVCQSSLGGCDGDVVYIVGESLIESHSKGRAWGNVYVEVTHTANGDSQLQRTEE